MTSQSELSQEAIGLGAIIVPASFLTALLLYTISRYVPPTCDWIQNAPPGAEIPITTVFRTITTTELYRFVPPPSPQDVSQQPPGGVLLGTDSTCQSGDMTYQQIFDPRSGRLMLADTSDLTPQDVSPYITSVTLP